MFFFKEKIWQNKKRRKLFVALSSTLLALAILFTTCAVYLGSYYHADDSQIADFTFTTGYAFKETKNKDGDLIFTPQTEEVTTGFIFYPGGKVEHTAYIPLMRALARMGILCIIEKMPFRLAVFDINAADGVTEKYPQITSWYIGGHSLGGAMAASYAKTHANALNGVVLLAAYSTENLQNSGLRVLSIYGDKDGVLDHEKYQSRLSNLPTDYTEKIIEGGNHAYFGMYGNQNGDGVATIENGYQIILTAHYIYEFVGNATPTE